MVDNYLILILLSITEEDSSDDEEYEVDENSMNASNMNSDDEADSDDEMDVMENNLNWRDNLAEKARASYLERQSNTQNLMKIVYGAINAVSNFNI